MNTHQSAGHFARTYCRCSHQKQILQVSTWQTGQHLHHLVSPMHITHPSIIYADWMPLLLHNHHHQSTER